MGKMTTKQIKFIEEQLEKIYSNKRAAWMEAHKAPVPIDWRAVFSQQRVRKAALEYFEGALQNWIDYGFKSNMSCLQVPLWSNAFSSKDNSKLAKLLREASDKYYAKHCVYEEARQKHGDTLSEKLTEIKAKALFAEDSESVLGLLEDFKNFEA